MKAKKKVLLHEILRRLITDRKISVKELSKMTAIPQSTVSSYLTGAKASYDPTHLSAIAEALEISLDYLIYGQNQDASKVLQSLLTENVFDGYLKVKIERVIK